MKAIYLLIFLLFAGCSYKPSSHYAKKELEGNVFVKLFIDIKDPQNAVLIKDSLNELILQKLDSKLVHDESYANTIMSIKLNSVSMTELQYDELGFNKLYRATVGILVSYTKKDTGVTKSFTVSGEHNFSIDDGTTITGTKRFEAIKEASDDALDEVLSKIAVSSFNK